MNRRAADEEKRGGPFDHLAELAQAISIAVTCEEPTLSRVSDDWEPNGWVASMGGNSQPTHNSEGKRGDASFIRTLHVSSLDE